MLINTSETRLLTITQAAQRLGIHRTTLIEWMKCKESPPHKRINGRAYFTQAGIIRWINGGEHAMD